MDSDQSCKVSLKKIITEGNLGVVIGEAESEEKALSSIMTLHPDIVLMELLMPESDGIKTIEHLRTSGFAGHFIIISQVTDKEIVAEAYKKGIEFFINKPINRIEIQNILRKITENLQLKKSLLSIQEVLSSLGLDHAKQKQPSVKTIVFSILNDMGIVGEVGSEDIVLIIEYLMHQSEKVAQLPPLKDLYQAVAATMASNNKDINKESKAIEQRVRRTILTAINNLATWGIIDYTNAEFEYYAPRYFDFQEIRNYMQSIREGANKKAKVKINSKKFLQVLYLETIKKQNTIIG